MKPRNITTILVVLLFCLLITPCSKAFASDAALNGHRYRLSDTGMTWIEAKTYCENLGGHLASITSQEEQNMIAELVLSGGKNSYWLGGEKDSSGAWLWIDGSAWEYTNWARGQPDNYTRYEDKLMIYRVSNPRNPSSPGTWNDLQADGTCQGESFFGTENFGFVCEWDTEETSLDISVLERGTSAATSNFGGLLSRIINGQYTDYRAAPLNEASISGISSANFSKTGFTADGNTRLMLRVQTSKPGTVTFSVPAELKAVLENLSRSSKSNSSVSIRTEQITDSLCQATAILTAPADYPSSMNFPAADFDCSVRFTADDGSVTTKTLSLSINAAPVVFIHGIFGESASAFGKGEDKGIWHILNQAGVRTYFWNYDNMTGPNDVIPAGKTSMLYGKIVSIFQDYHSRGLACTRVDLIGHSMGGLMARRFTVADYGHKTGLISYGSGAVRRIITVATPHRGSPLAALVGKTVYAQELFEIIGSLFIAGYDHVRDASSAWRDLYEPNSIAIGFPDDVPVYSICGNIKQDLSQLASNATIFMKSGRIALVQSLPVSTYFVEVAVKLLQRELRDAVFTVQGLTFLINNALFSGEEHDICVSVPSAVSDFSESYSTKYNGMDYRHDTICKQDTTGVKILELLKGSESAFKVFGSVSASSQSDNSSEVSSNIDELAEKLNSTPFGINKSLSLSIEPENLNISSGQTGQINISVVPNTPLLGSLNLLLSNQDGIRSINISPDEEGNFSAGLTFSEKDCGIWNIACLAFGTDWKICMSNAKTAAVLPVIDDSNISGLEFSDSSGNIFLQASSDIPAGLYAVMKDGSMYDVSSPLTGTQWTFSTSDIVSISSTGKLHGIKAGSTDITAEYRGFRASVHAEVSAEYRSADIPDDTTDIPDTMPDTITDIPDTTSDTITDTPDTHEDNDNNTESDPNNDVGDSKSGGGCSSGIYGIVSVMLLLFMHKRIKF